MRPSIWKSIDRAAIAGLVATALTATASIARAEPPAPAAPAAAATSQTQESPAPRAVPATTAAADVAPGVASDCPAIAGCRPPVNWLKVPPVESIPRLGDFIIPPDRPGYYSLMDWFQGKCRDNPPKFPYPPFSADAGSFFDNDFRYLDDPDNTQTDWLDPIKRIHIGDDWLLSTGGEFRARWVDEQGSRLTATTNDYDLIRTRVYGDLWFRDRVRLYVEFIDAHAFNESLPPLAIDNNPDDFLNLFMELKLFQLFDSPVYTRIGRQELLYGSERLISPLDWANTRRTFQGAKTYWHTDKFDFDIFWAKPVPVSGTSLDWWNVDQNLYGIWATYKPKKGTTRDFYVVEYNQASPLVSGGAVRPSGPLDVTTVGTRWAGDQDGRLLYDFEGMFQSGTRASSEIYAFAATSGLGYRAKNLNFNPAIWFYYDYASGTPDPSALGTTQTFNQLFPFGHYYLGFNDFVGRQNIQDFNTQFSINPTPFITALFQYHHFALAEAKDALYNAAGAVLRVDPTGKSGIDVGDEFDLTANVHINQHNDLLFGVSFFDAGPFLRSAGAGVPVPPRLYYLQYSYKW
jgi:hypothetical protein